MDRLNWIAKNKDYLLNILKGSDPIHTTYVSNYVGSKLFPETSLLNVNVSDLKKDIQESNSFTNEEKVQLCKTMDSIFTYSVKGGSKTPMTDELDNIVYGYYRKNKNTFNKWMDDVLDKMKHLSPV